VHATLISEPSHAHPGENALQMAPGDAKHSPVAAQPAASGKPQTPLFGQSLSLTQELEVEPLDEAPELVVVPEIATPDPPAPLEVPPLDALPLEAPLLEVEPEPPSPAVVKTAAEHAARLKPRTPEASTKATVLMMERYRSQESNRA
jgi:hypothetical protein